MKRRWGEELRAKAGMLAVLTAGFIIAAPAPATAANCTLPAGPEGSMIYGTTAKTMFYCNGTGWVGSAGISALASLTDVSVSAPANGNVLSYNTATSKWESTASATSQWTTSGLNIYYNLGNVGIGTPAPGAPLHVLGGSIVGGTIVADGPAAGYSSFGLSEAGVSKGSIYWHPGTQGIVFNGPGKWWFETGNVGIGTATPSGQLEVKSAANTHNALFLNTTTAAAWADSIVFQEAGTSKASIQHHPGVLAGGLLFNTGGAGSPANTRMAIDSTGNVGIGTAAPAYKLTVLDAGGSTFRVSGDASTVSVGAQSNHNLSILANGSSRIYVENTGNVGIGTAAPGAKLEVAGQVKITGGVPGVGKVLTSDAAGLASWGSAGGASQWTTVVNDIYYNLGNVGIGTASPASPLTVTRDGSDDIGTTFRGVGTFRKADGSKGMYLGYDTLSQMASFLSQGASSGFSFTTHNGTAWGERMRIHSDGNVGIGTTGPAALLDVNGNVIMRGGVFNSYDPNTPANFLHRLTHGGLGDAALQLYNAGTLKIQLSANGNSYFNNAGNVGIGIASPNAKLEVRKANPALLNLRLASPEGGNMLQFSDEVDYVSYIGIDATNHYLGFGAGGITDMVLKAGNVGIGTAAPGEKLYVLMPGAESTFGGNGAAAVLASNAGPAVIATSVSGDIIRGYQGAAQVFVVKNNGNVGIGTASPLYKLDVVGSNPDARIAGSSTTDSARLMFFDNGPAPNQIWVNGIWRAQQGSSYVVANGGAVGVFLVSGATAWSATSDERVKHVYGSIENSLEKISSLRRVYFKFKKDDKAASRMHVGVIAQDVRAVLPEAVDENSDGILSVRYTDLVPLLIGGIQDLESKNDALKAENNALEKRVEAKNSDLEARIEKLEKERGGEQMRSSPH